MNVAFRWKWSTDFNVWISMEHTLSILLFAQIYILFEYFEGFLIPCIYRLTSKQDQITYEKIFNHVLSIGLSHVNSKFSPEALTCDFEL